MASIKAKIAAAPLTLALVLALSACGGSGGGTSDTPATVGGGDTGGATGGGDTGGGDTGGGDTGGGDTGGGDTGGGDTGGGDTGGGDTGGGGPDPDVIFEVSNPYAVAGATSVDDVKVDNMFVFGDSYSVSRFVRDGDSSVRVNPWADTMVANGFVDESINFARSGARAGTSDTQNSFSRQVEDGNDDPNNNPSFFEQDQRHDGDDLTIVYFGYNDLGRSLTPARDRYIENIDRLIASGATANDQKIFVTLLHDWDRNPEQLANGATGDVETLNSAITQIANDRDGVVAVDLYTLFNRIYDNPGRFGFNNVATADPDNADSSALYVDANHFGQRGVDIIAQVYQHYLTRAWDWSNTLANGAQTIAQLNSDIDEGRLALSLSQDQKTGKQTLSFFSVGNDFEPGVGAQTGFGTSIKSLSQDNSGGNGLGMNYRLGQNAQMGLVVSEYRDGSDIEHQRAVSGTSVKSHGMSIYLDQKVGKFNMDTRLTLAENDYSINSFDAVVDGHNQASTSGSAMSLRQKISRVMRAGSGWVQPWADLSVERQEIDSYTISSPFIADTRFSAADTNDVWAGVGVGYAMDPVKLGHESQLKLSAGAAYKHSIHRDDYKVTITDTAFGGRENAHIKRGAAEQFSFNMRGGLDVGENVSFGAGYNFTMSSEAEDDIHSLRADLTFRF